MDSSRVDPAAELRRGKDLTAVAHGQSGEDMSFEQRFGCSQAEWANVTRNGFDEALYKKLLQFNVARYLATIQDVEERESWRCRLERFNAEEEEEAKEQDNEDDLLEPQSGKRDFTCHVFP